MTLNEVIEKINAAILEVPQEERIRKLAGKTSFLQGLLRQEMVESDEAKAALAEYHMRAEITWDFGVPVPTLDVYVQLTEDSPYAIIGHRYSHGSWKFLSFKRKKCTINGRATMSADLAVLSEFGPKGDITVAEYYAERFRNIQKACEGTIQMVKGIDLLISTFGHEKAAELVQSIKNLDSNTGLNFFNSQYKGFWNRSIFNDAVRDKILALDVSDKDNLSDLSDLAVDILLDATDYIGNQPEQFPVRNSDIPTMKNSAGFHSKLQEAVDEWAADRTNDGADLQMPQSQAAKFVWDLYMLYIIGD